MTLIEVIIALAIFSIISVFTVSSTSVGIRIKNKIAAENDYYHTLRTILRYLDRDISLAFHAFPDTNQADQYRVQNLKTDPLLVKYERVSFFKGAKDKLFFTSSSHQRLYKNTNETDTCKISYYLEQDPDNPAIENLIKKESGFIDDKEEETGAKYVVASGVESISFRYFSPKGVTEDGTWVDKWDSTQGDYINTFPMAVEVTLVLASLNDKDKMVKIVEKIKLFNPNNLGESAKGGYTTGSILTPTETEKRAIKKK